MMVRQTVGCSPFRDICHNNLMMNDVEIMLVAHDNYIQPEYIFLPNIRREKLSLSIAHAISRLPLTHTVSDKIRKAMPVGSKERNGTNCLHTMVNMGENRNSERLFLPKYCTHCLPFEVA